MLIKMAWRNLWRSKRRTLITAITVAFGVLLAVTFTAIEDYAYTNMINTSASMGFGHITVEPPGYDVSPSLDRRINNVSDIRESVLRIPGVTSTVVRIMGQAMFASASKSIGGTFFAIDPALENADTNMFIKSLIEGSIFNGIKGRGIIIGEKMAEK